MIIDELNELIELAEKGCTGRCSGVRPTFCDPCEARDGLSYQTDIMEKLIKLARLNKELFGVKVIADKSDFVLSEIRELLREVFGNDT